MSSIIDINSVKPAKTKNQKKQFKTAIIILLSIIGLAVIAYFMLVPQKKEFVLNDYESAVVKQGDMVATAQASGTVAIPNQIIVLSPYEGYAAALFVKVGDTVYKNQLLARITVPDIDDSIADAQKDVSDAKLNSQKTAVQNAYTIETKKRQIVELESQLADMDKEIDKLTQLVAINSSRQSDLDTKIASRKNQAFSLETAKLDLANTQELQKIDLAVTKSNLEKLQTKLDRLLVKKAESDIKSPMSGDIMEYEKALAVSGSLIAGNKSLFTVADPKSTTVELELDEQYTTAVKINDTVQLVINNSTITGKITAIGKVAQTSSTGLGATVSVTVKPDTTTGLLLGSTVIGNFALGVQKNILTLPRGPYLTTGSQKYLYVIKGNKAVQTGVQFGTIQENSIQVLSGVSAGDKVITSGYQSFINYKEITLQEAK